jgi:acyl-homoserine lactone acylase PvdQ
MCRGFGQNKAKSLLAGGNSGDPSSKHFNDQSEMYQKDNLKTYYFTKTMY